MDISDSSSNGSTDGSQPASTVEAGAYGSSSDTEAEPLAEVKPKQKSFVHQHFKISPDNMKYVCQVKGCR